MSKPDDAQHFHIRFVAGLKEKLQMARGRRSLNMEINDRLQRSFGTDDASRLAELLRPVLDRLNDDDRGRFVELTAEIVDLIDKAGKRRK